MLRTYAYVDAFNLYYGCLKGSRFKWLDLHRMVKAALPSKYDILRIKYYTARVSAWPHDLDAPNRQALYLRALGTLPMAEVHFGHFLTHEVRMRLAHPPATGPSFATVIRTEEKGSDVNLATHLVADAYENRFDAAVIVSNDSDLLEPVKIVRHHLGRVVAVLNPRHDHAVVLRRNATFMRRIRESYLKCSLFPTHLTDNAGAISKPPAW